MLDRISNSFRIFVSSERKPRVIASARCASEGDPTVPVRTKPPGTERTRTALAPRVICRSAASMAVAEGRGAVGATAGVAAVCGAPSAWPLPRTVIAYSAMAVPSSPVAMMVVRPAATPMTKMLVGEAGCTRATLGSAASTVVAGAGKVRSRPDPASSSTGSAAVGATCRAVCGMGAACSGTVPAEDKGTEAGRWAGGRTTLPWADAPVATRVAARQARGTALITGM